MILHLILRILHAIHGVFKMMLYILNTSFTIMQLLSYMICLWISDTQAPTMELHDIRTVTSKPIKQIIRTVREATHKDKIGVWLRKNILKLWFCSKCKMSV